MNANGNKRKELIAKAEEIITNDGFRTSNFAKQKVIIETMVDRGLLVSDLIVLLRRHQYINLLHLYTQNTNIINTKNSDDKRRKLKIVSLNMGYNVMSNKAIGSEKPMVQLCQKTYNANSNYKGWTDNNKKIPSCTSNSAHFLSTYKHDELNGSEVMGFDLLGLQEVNEQYGSALEKQIHTEGLKSGRNYMFETGYYFGDFGVTICYDKNVLGEGIRVTPHNYLFGEGAERGKAVKSLTGKEDMRGLVAVYFPHFNNNSNNRNNSNNNNNNNNNSNGKGGLLAVNVHAPHRINLLKHLQSALDDLLLKVELMTGHASNVGRVILMGDFNDERGTMINKSINLNTNLNNHLTLNIPNRVRDGKLGVPKTCCADSKYQFVGDYILDTNNMNDNSNTNDENEVYFGLPLSHDRNIHHYSDHDPVILIE